MARTARALFLILAILFATCFFAGCTDCSCGCGGRHPSSSQKAAGATNGPGAAADDDGALGLRHGAPGDDDNRSRVGDDAPAHHGDTGCGGSASSDAGAQAVGGPGGRGAAGGQGGANGAAGSAGVPGGPGAAGGAGGVGGPGGGTTAANALANVFGRKAGGAGSGPGGAGGSGNDSGGAGTCDVTFSLSGGDSICSANIMLAYPDSMVSHSGLSTGTINRGDPPVENDHGNWVEFTWQSTPPGAKGPGTFAVAHFKVSGGQTPQKSDFAVSAANFANCLIPPAYSFPSYSYDLTCH